MDELAVAANAAAYCLSEGAPVNIEHLFVGSVLFAGRIVLPLFVSHFAREKGRNWFGWLLLATILPELGLFYITLADDLSFRRYFPQPADRCEIDDDKFAR